MCSIEVEAEEGEVASFRRDTWKIERRGNSLMIGFRWPSRGKRHHQNEWSVEKSQKRALKVVQGVARRVERVRCSESTESGYKRREMLRLSTAKQSTAQYEGAHDG